MLVMVHEHASSLEKKYDEGIKPILMVDSNVCWGGDGHG